MLSTLFTDGPSSWLTELTGIWGGNMYNRLASDVESCDKCQKLCQHYDSCTAVSCKADTVTCHIYHGDNFELVEDKDFISWQKKYPKSKFV